MYRDTVHFKIPPNRKKNLFSLFSNFIPYCPTFPSILLLLLKMYSPVPFIPSLISFAFRQFKWWRFNEPGYRLDFGSVKKSHEGPYLGC